MLTENVDLLEPVEDARLVYRGSLLRHGFWYVRIGQTSCRIGDGPVSRHAIKQHALAQQLRPVYLTNLGQIRFWQFRGMVYADTLQRTPADISRIFLGDNPQSHA